MFYIAAKPTVLLVEILCLLLFSGNSYLLGYAEVASVCCTVWVDFLSDYSWTHVGRPGEFFWTSL